MRNKNIVKSTLNKPCTMLLSEGENIRDWIFSSLYVTKIV